MRADKLIQSLKFKKVSMAIDSELDIKLLTQDTREVVENSIFVAVEGYTVDGHDFVTQAVEKGAKIIIARKPISVSVPVVYVQDTNRAMAILADVFYGVPSQKMRMIGVTGTNGKTTVTHLIEQIYRDLNQKTGLIGE